MIVIVISYQYTADLDMQNLQNISQYSRYTFAIFAKSEVCLLTYQSLSKNTCADKRTDLGIPVVPEEHNMTTVGWTPGARVSGLKLIRILKHLPKRDQIFENNK